MVRLHEEVAYFGYAHNLRLENGAVELVIATEFGPRIMRYALPGGPNLFAEISPRSQAKPTSYGEDWHIYGGHRLWYAPEHPERSYYPDNRRLAVERTARGVKVSQPVESVSGLEKQLELTLAEEGCHVTVQHRLRHHGSAPLTLAPWALSAMAPTGLAIFPHVPFRPHPDVLAPARPLVLWPFTRMDDPRFLWGDRTFRLQQDPARATPQKIGCYDPCGYMAYVLGETLFVKCHEPKPGPHADFGCNVETFTNELFLELETLGPEVTLSPGEDVEHVEHWFLFERFEAGDRSERALLAGLAPHLREIERTLGRSLSGE